MHPSQLGPYRIVRKIGEGGMGSIFEGVDDQDTRVAVKLLPDVLARQKGFMERFDIEIETLRILDHPNIVRLIGFGEQQGQLYYAMELVAGVNLEDRISSGYRFGWREVAQMSIHLCKALQHAHDRGIIHRDIKPENVMLTNDDVVKLTDFGIARLWGVTGITVQGGLIGTANFMSPEQAEGKPANERSDMYSLGMTIYALLTGEPPFMSDSLPRLLKMHRSAKPDPVRIHAPHVPESFEKLIGRLLEKEAARRIARPDALARRLQDLLDDPALADTPDQPSTGAPPVAGDTDSADELAPTVASPAHETEAGEPAVIDFAETEAPTLVENNPADALQTVVGSDRPQQLPPTIAGEQIDDDDHGQSATMVSAVEAEIDEDDAAAMHPTVMTSDPVASDSSVEIDMPVIETGVSSDGDDEPTTFRRKPKNPPGAPGAVIEFADDEPVSPQTVQPVVIPGAYTTTEEANELDQRLRDTPRGRGPIEITRGTIVSLLAFVILAGLAFYTLKPRSGDELYELIVLADRSGNIDRLIDAELYVAQFQDRFPRDERIDEVNAVAETIDLLQYEKTIQRRSNFRTGKLGAEELGVEQAYLEASRIARTDINLGAKKFRAIIDMYAGAEIESKPVSKCLKLARRRFDELDEHIKLSRDQIAVLRKQFDRAESLKVSDPETAKRIFQGIIDFYDGKPWAQERVDMAKRAIAPKPLLD